MKTKIIIALVVILGWQIEAQTVTNTIFDSPEVQANIVKAHQMLDSAKLELLHSNEPVSASDSPVAPAPAQARTITNQNRFTPEDLAYMKAKGIDPSTVTIVQPITNKEGTVIPPADLDYFRKQGYTDAEIQQSYQPAQPQKTTLSSTPSDLKNAYIWMDNFIGMTNANIMADIISMKAETLKFRLYDKDYDYSGHYTVMLNTPRKHANPYFGLGSPETVKILILENVGGETFPLQNATIWEKKANFINAVAMDKEWIYSGTYTIQN